MRVVFVNAANAALRPGGGIDAAVRVALPGLTDVTSAPDMDSGNKVDPGDALLVAVPQDGAQAIMAVAPNTTVPAQRATWQILLASVYDYVFMLAPRTEGPLVVPCLGIGAFNCEPVEARRIAAGAVREFAGACPNRSVVLAVGAADGAEFPAYKKLFPGSRVVVAAVAPPAGGGRGAGTRSGAAGAGAAAGAGKRTTQGNLPARFTAAGDLGAQRNQPGTDTLRRAADALEEKTRYAAAHADAMTPANAVGIFNGSIRVELVPVLAGAPPERLTKAGRRRANAAAVVASGAPVLDANGEPTFTRVYVPVLPPHVSLDALPVSHEFAPWELEAIDLTRTRLPESARLAWYLDLASGAELYPDETGVELLRREHGPPGLLGAPSKQTIHAAAAAFVAASKQNPTLRVCAACGRSALGEVWESVDIFAGAWPGASRAEVAAAERRHATHMQRLAYTPAQSAAFDGKSQLYQTLKSTYVSDNVTLSTEGVPCMQRYHVHPEGVTRTALAPAAATAAAAGGAGGGGAPAECGAQAMDDGDAAAPAAGEAMDDGGGRGAAPPPLARRLVAEWLLDLDNTVRPLTSSWAAAAAQRQQATGVCAPRVSIARAR